MKQRKRSSLKNKFKISWLKVVATLKKCVKTVEKLYFDFWFAQFALIELFALLVSLLLLNNLESYDSTNSRSFANEWEEGNVSRMSYENKPRASSIGW